MVSIKKMEEYHVELVSNLMMKILVNEEIHFTSNKGLSTLFQFYGKKELKKRLNEKATNFYVFFTLENIFSGFGEMENNHLVSLYIDQESRGLGIGTMFINFIFKNRIPSHNITVYSSPLSIEFYQKHGFIQQSINCVEKYGILYMPMTKE